MDANPILAETVRGNWVENRHRGAFAIVDAKGKIIASAGDIERPVFPRSAIKSMQALAIFAREAEGKFHHTDEELALAMGVPTKGYVGREHEVQRAVRAAVEAVIGEPLSEDRCGTDGSSIPTFAAPLRAFAFGFARMATGQGIAPELASASRRLFDAATSHPLLVAGTGHADTLIMEAFGGRVMQKVGAEGVQCGAIRDKGWGYALKCDDGNIPASQAMLAGLLLRYAEPDEGQRAVLERFREQTIRSVRGADVGVLRAALG